MSKKIEKIISRLEDIQSDLDQLAEEAQDYFDERSEKWQESEKGEAWCDKISALEDASYSVGDAVDYLSDLE